MLPGPGDGIVKLNKFMENIYTKVFELARERNLPILDLSRTFDIYNTNLYKS